MTQTTPIKATLGFKKNSAKDVLARVNAVLGGIFTDTDDYPNPPIDQATLKSQADALSAGISAALDGGKKAIAEREHQKAVVIKSLRQIGQYAEANCKDEITIFLKSGYNAVSSTRTPAVPLSAAFRKIVPGGNSGQILVTLVAQAAAFSYVLRWAPAAAGGTLGTWIEQPVGNTRPPALVAGLIPGTTYVFQVRAVTKAGYSDWSDSVTRIAT
ncbi:MAG TPA: fibronectin type III domain-containing protein [Terriglobia bacterium]|jgi:hypothetical protein